MLICFSKFHVLPLGRRVRKSEEIRRNTDDVLLLWNFLKAQKSRKRCISIAKLWTTLILFGMMELFMMRHLRSYEFISQSVSALSFLMNDPLDFDLLITMPEQGNLLDFVECLCVPSLIVLKRHIFGW